MSNHRLNSRSIPAAITVAAAMILSLIGSSAVATPSSTAADDAAGVIAGVAPNPDLVDVEVLHDGSLKASNDASTVELPAKADSPVVIEDDRTGADLEVGLPVADNASATVAADGTVLYADPTGYADIAVQTSDDGVRVQTIITSADAPGLFVYPLGKLSLAVSNPDGSVDITSPVEGGGISVTRVATPWAVDAGGRSVPTHYEFEAAGLVQVVGHRGAGFTYPIVADPSFRVITGTNWWFGGPFVEVEMDRAQTLRIFQTGSVALAIAYLLSKVPQPYVVAVGTLVGVVGASLVTWAGSAYVSGNCIALRWYYKVRTPQTPIGTFYPLNLGYGTGNCY